MEKDKRCVIFIYIQQGFLNWRDELEALSVFFKELNFFLSFLSLKEGSSNGGGFVLLQTIMTVLDFSFYSSFLAVFKDFLNDIEVIRS